MLIFCQTLSQYELLQPNSFPFIRSWWLIPSVGGLLGLLCGRFYFLRQRDTVLPSGPPLLQLNLAQTVRVRIDSDTRTFSDEPLQYEFLLSDLFLSISSWWLIIPAGCLLELLLSRPCLLRRHGVVRTRMDSPGHSQSDSDLTPKWALEGDTILSCATAKQEVGHWLSLYQRLWSVMIFKKPDKKEW